MTLSSLLYLLPSMLPGVPAAAAAPKGLCEFELRFCMCSGGTVDECSDPSGVVVERYAPGGAGVERFECS